MITLTELLAELESLGVHFWLDQDRLRYKAPKNTLSPERLEQIRGYKTEIINLLREAELTQSEQPQLKEISREGYLPLSFAQQRLWHLYELEPDSPAYNMPMAYRIKGNLNLLVLEQSFNQVVQRQAVLRTTFQVVDKQPTQLITSDANLRLQIIDLQHEPISEREAVAQAYAHKIAHTPFNLSDELPVRLSVFCLANDDHVLLVNMPAIVCDGSSSDIFLQELVAYYRALKTQQPDLLPPLPIQYVDYAHWQREWLQGTIHKSQLSFWKQQLAGELSLLNLPTDRLRPAISSGRGDRVASVLPKSLNESLNSLSQECEVTLFMTLLAAFKVMLHRYSSQTDILVSFANSGRSQLEIEGLIGLFSNTLPLRTLLDSEMSFRELLVKVRQVVLGALANQDLPFEQILEGIPTNYQTGKSPLLQVTLALNPPWTKEQGGFTEILPGLELSSIFGYIHSGILKYDLTLVMRETPQGLRAIFEYSKDLFDEATINRMLGHFQTLLEAVVADSNQSIATLALLTKDETKQLVTKQPTTTFKVPSTSIHTLFEQQVEKSPEAVAVSYQDQSLTYRELNNRANQLAHYLQILGVKPETPVGLRLGQSLEAIIAILAILKAGGVYVPFDPNDPPYRLSLIQKETQMPVLLTQELMNDELNDYSTKIVYLDHDWEIIQQQPNGNLLTNFTPDALATILYSNIQTEALKGICLTHKNIVQLAKNAEWIEFNATDIFIQIAPLATDTGIFEVWSSLLNGGTLVIYPSDTSSLEYLGKTIQQHQVTILSLPTRIFHKVVEEQPENLQSIRKLFVSGDWLSPSRAHKLHQLLPETFLYNTYSVAENTGFTCCHLVTEPLPEHTTIPIGSAIANTQTYVLDRHLQAVPVGVVGELYIGGDRLAQGYYNRPELTNVAFISNPFSQEPDSRLYKTGDLVRYLPDGNLEFISRIEELVTIHGLQIENGRIETALCQHPAIRETYILGQQKATSAGELVAYIVLHSNQTATIAELRQFLKQKLSAHMLPTSCIFLDILPLKKNGEINLHALPNQDKTINLSEEFDNPRDEVELKLSNIWKNLLGCEAIGIYSNFFELGGNSLLSVRLVAEIERTFNYYFPLSSFFQMSTVAEIAKWIREKPSEATSLNELPPGLCQEDYRAFLSLCGGRVGKHVGKRGLFVEVSPDEMRSSHPFIWIGYIDFSRNLGLQQPVYTVPGCSWTPFQSTKNYIEAIASVIVDELLSVQPEGPYLLGGNCYEGIVAVEVAQQLRKRGKQVALLAVINRPGPSSIYSLCRKLDYYYCAFRFHLLALMELQLLNKWLYISARLFRHNLKQPLKKAHIEQDPNKFQNEYDRISSQAWESVKQATKNYVPKEYPEKVVLTAPTKSELSSSERDLFWTDLSWLFPRYGWEHILTGKVKFHRIQCAHPDIGMKQYAEEIGRIIWKSSNETR
jgi:amino acid adenylation domain-containing protein